MVLKDYIIEADIDCNPFAESCFVWVCDPEIDGEDVCTGDLGEDTWYYKIAYKNAMNIITCDNNDNDCHQFECSIDEKDCYEVLCSGDTLIEYGVDGSCHSEMTF